MVYFAIISSGGDLAKKIKQAGTRGFSETQVLEWFCQMLIAIKDIHDKKIIHRDIKSQNVFLTKSGLAKIGDFGVSTQTNTCANTIVGTPFYLSPEIINGAKYDSKTDIWSLGVLLYELCCLDYPFKVPNNSLAALALKVLKGKYSPLPKTYSPELSKILAAMMNVNAKARPTVDQLMSRLSINQAISL
jgi:NIMA (never in mitosis gene a)-related kinase 1/4/5